MKRTNDAMINIAMFDINLVHVFQTHCRVQKFLALNIYCAHEQAVLNETSSIVIVRDGTHFLWLLLSAIELTHAVLKDVIVLQIGTDTLLLLGKVNDTTLPV